MPEITDFSLEFVKEEQHLMLPTVASIKLTQNLYDVLFQYLISEEQEAKLKRFIDMLEAHIKRKDQAPFSMPIAELEFLDEGLEELRLLNWMEVPVAVFRLSLPAEVAETDYPDAVELTLGMLDRLMVFSHPAEGDLIWVYPYLLVR